MNWIDIAWPMIGAASATLAGIHVLIWFKQKRHRANLAFALAAISLSVVAIFELLMMRAQGPEAYAALLRWVHVPIATLVVGIIAFLLLRFRAGNRRLAALALLTRLACIPADFLTGANLQFLQIGDLHKMSVPGGGIISIPAADAVANPWMALGTASSILLLLFVFSVIRDLYRWRASSARQNALLVCYAIVVLVVSAHGWNWAVVHQHVRGPLMFSPAFLFVMLCMGYQLGADLLRANQLALGLSAARRDLVDSRKRMKMAVEAGGVGLLNWNMVDGTAWFSEQGLSIIGHEPGEIASMDLLAKRIEPSDRERFDTSIREASRHGREYREEFRVVLPDGRHRWIAMRGKADRSDPAAPRMDAAFVDITSRKEAEDRFRMVVETAPTAMLMFDLKGRIVLANRQAESLFGFTTEEFQDMSVDRLVPEQLGEDRRHRPRLRAGIAAMKMAIGSGRDLLGSRRDGSVVQLKVTLNPIPIGPELMLLAAITDLSEMNRLERESALQRDELAHLSRVAMLAELSGSLAHELNQPLTAILANAQAAVRFLGRDPPDLAEVRNGLQSIIESDKRAGEVIRRLRSLLRKEHADYRYLNLNDLVQDVLRIIRSDLLNRNTSTFLELAEDPPPVCGDAVQLQQVLLNLIINASDAMKDMQEREITLRTGFLPPDRLVVSVSDIGHGIPGQDLDRIFSPFVTTKQDGLGLGLSVCRTIITAHNGRLWAANNADRGTTVSFELPAAIESESPGNDEIRASMTVS